MKNKLLKLICVVFSIFIVSGCWNYSELNDLAIATAFAIDKENDEYKVSLAIANSNSAQSSSKEGQSQITILEGKGTTLSGAMEKIDLKSPKTIYLNHLTAIIISEKVAKNGVNNIVDLLLREPETRKKFYLLIAKDTKAGDVLKILTPLDFRPSQSIASTIQNSSEYQALTTTLTYSNFINDIVQNGNHPVLTSISVEGKKDDGSKYESIQQSEPEATIKLGPLALFKNDKFETFATASESEGINLILNRVKKMTVKAKCENNYVVGDLKSIQTKVKVHLKDNEPSVDVHVSGSGSIVEINCDADLMDAEVINELNENIEKETKKIVAKGLKVAQDNKTDVLSFGHQFYQYYPKYFKSVKKTWDEKVFPNLKVNIKVDLDIETKGSLEQTIREEEE